jgi:hypothetical protein
MAEFLEEDLVGLYRYASVAECWSEEEVHELMGRHPGERALTWSHLVRLAAVDKPRERARWTRRARIEQLSVRELAMRLGRREANASAGLRLERAVRAASRFLAELESDRLGDVGVVRNRKALEHALDVHEKIRALNTLRIEALCAAHAALGEADVARDAGAAFTSRRRHLQRRK